MASAVPTHHGIPSDASRRLPRIDSVHGMSKPAMALVLLALVASACSSSSTKTATNSSGGGNRPIIVRLQGDKESPGSGDPDGKGNAKLTFDAKLHQICSDVTVSNLDPVVAVHLQQGPAGQPGPIILPLPEMTSTHASGCRPIDEARFTEVRSHPEDYFINVRTVALPGGAIRGQLKNGPVSKFPPVHIPGAQSTSSTSVPPTSK